MKIALINENSQAAKNGIIEAALKKVVEPMGHEVVNYGMYAADDAAQLTYVQCKSRSWASIWDAVVFWLPAKSARWKPSSPLLHGESSA